MTAFWSQGRGSASGRCLLRKEARLQSGVSPGRRYLIYWNQEGIIVAEKSFDYPWRSDRMALFRSCSEAGSIFKFCQNLTQSHKATEKGRNVVPVHGFKVVFWPRCIPIWRHIILIKPCGVRFSNRKPVALRK